MLKRACLSSDRFSMTTYDYNCPLEGRVRSEQGCFNFELTIRHAIINTPTSFVGRPLEGTFLPLLVFFSCRCWCFDAVVGVFHQQLNY